MREIIFLKTPRLTLRYFTKNDAGSLYELDSDIEVIRFTNLGVIKERKPINTDYESIKQRILPKFIKGYGTNHQYGYWAVIEKASDEFIGWFHL